MFDHVYPPQSHDKVEVESSRNEILNALKEFMAEALLGKAKGDSMMELIWVLQGIRAGRYSKEELELSDSDMSRLNAFVETWDTKRKKIDEVRDLYHALYRETEKLYLFTPWRKKPELKKKAIRLKTVMTGAHLTYRECGIQKESVEQFIND